MAIDLRGSARPDLSGLMIGVQQMFQPDFEERLRRQSLANVAARIGTMEVDTMSDEQVAELAAMLNLTPEQLRAANPATGLGRRIDVEAGRQPGMVGRGVRATGAELDAATATAGAQVSGAAVQDRLNQAMLNAGIPEKSVEADLLRFQAERVQTQAQLEAFEAMAEAYKSLDPEERMHAAAALANPRFLDHLELMRQMDLQMALSRVAQAPNPEDLLGLKLKFHDEFRNMEATFEEGNTSPGQLDAWIARYNSLIDMHSQLFPNDPVTIIDAVERLWGREASGVNMRTMPAADARTLLAAMQIRAGNFTLDQLNAAQTWTEEEKAAVRDLVTQLESRSNVGALERTSEAAANILSRSLRDAVRGTGTGTGSSSAFWFGIPQMQTQPQPQTQP